MRIVPPMAALLASALLLFAAAGGAAPAALQPAEDDPQFAGFLAQAATARERGDLTAARAALLQAERQVATTHFHSLVADATQAFDENRHGAACVSLSKATQHVTPWLWFALGFAGQAVFSARFVVQWIASERKKRSVVPVAFWYLSIVGSILVLAYALVRVDPVFILAYGFNSFIYVRNLILIYRAHPPAAAEAQGASS
jgi:lipid-A-disaccharide synthase-like uncharacterized protein